MAQPEPVFTGHGEVAPETIAAHWQDGSWTIEGLIDPDRGLVRAWTETGDVDPSPPDVRAHLCASELAAAIPEIETSILHALRDADPGEGGVACTDRECTFLIPGEYEPGRIAIFDHASGRPTALVAYLEVSQFSPDADEESARVRAWADAELQRSCGE